jgi:hypothetical protein
VPRCLAELPAVRPQLNPVQIQPKAVRNRAVEILAGCGGAGPGAIEELAAGTVADRALLEEARQRAVVSGVG